MLCYIHAAWLGANLNNSHSNYDTDLEEGPPKHTSVVAIKCVTMPGLSGFEELLVASHLV